MGKTLTCPFCYNKDTLKVVYCYKGHKVRNKQLNKYNEQEVKSLLKDGTIYRTERPKYVKYDFDGVVTEIGYTRDYINPPTAAFLVIKSNEKEYLFLDSSYSKYIEINNN